jgi:dihydrolipoamide dehydrogenase
VESPASGTLGRILVPEGVEIPVLTVVGVILHEGESLAALPAAEGASSATAPPPAGSAAAPPRGEGAYDVAVVGAGVGGYVAAIRAAQLGAKVLVVEKERLGGTCLNRGCIPTKCFLSDVKPLLKVRSSSVYEGGDALRVDLRRMVARKDDVVRAMTRGVAKLLQTNGVRLVRGEASVVEAGAIRVAGGDEPGSYRAGSIILATGSRPAAIPGVAVDGRRVLSSDQILEIQQIPRDLIVIGGGVVGLEFACIFNALGSKVTVLEMLPTIAAGEDDEVIRALTLLLARRGIEIVTAVEVVGAEAVGKRVGVTFRDASGKADRASGDRLLVAAGRVPVTEGLGLERIGVALERGFVRVNARMETCVEGIYAVGDVVGGMMLAHAASAEGIVAVENARGRCREMDYHRIPSCIYTFPEVASVGLRERDARAGGLDVRVGRFPYGSSGKAMAMGEPDGFVKIIAEASLGRILGLHILGEHATDLMGEGLLAMGLEATVEDLGGVVKGHPTLSEAVMEAALDWSKEAIHIPPRR